MRGAFLAATLSLTLASAWAAGSPVVSDAAAALEKDPASAANKATVALSAQGVAPADVVALHAIRGRAHLALEEYDVAVADLTAAIDPSLASKDVCAAQGNLYVFRGEAYQLLQQHRLAAADFVRAAECEPTNADIQVKLGQAYFYFDRARARDTISLVLTMRPNDAKILGMRARNYQNMQEYELAIADYNRQIELEPKDAEAYNNRATAYIALGRYRDAIADLDKSIALEPDKFLPYVNRAQLKLLLCQYKDAREDLAKGKALYADPKVKAEFARSLPAAFVKQIEAYMEQVEQSLKDAPE